MCVQDGLRVLGPAQVVAEAAACTAAGGAATALLLSRLPVLAGLALSTLGKGGGMRDEGCSRIRGQTASWQCMQVGVRQDRQALSSTFGFSAEGFLISPVALRRRASHSTLACEG